MLIYCAIIVCIAIWGSNGQIVFAPEEQCSTALGTQGICISLANCSPILNLLDKFETLSVTETKTLQNSQCGLAETTPKVCCPLDTKGPAVTPKPTVDRILELVPDVSNPPDVSSHPKLRLLNNEFCGPVTESKIIGGNKTLVLEFPWMALIGYNVKGSITAFLCGGTLINKRYVLTAAHCVTGLDHGQVLSGVRVGDHNLLMEQDCDEEDEKQTPVCADKYQNFFFEKIHVHSGYTPKKFDNDIALIRLDSDADFTSQNVRPICLPIGNYMTLKSSKAVVTGWGTTEKGYRSPYLLKVTLDIASNNECDRVWHESNGLHVTYKQFCAGGKNGQDSCGGDSGGPLQYPAIINGVPKYIQYGIVSFGTLGCAVEGYPGVYTKVAYYMDWILDTITE